MSLLQYNLSGSNTDGSFTVDDSNSFCQSLQNSSNSSRKQIFRDFFLFYHGIVCCVYTLESPHRGDSNEYTQHTIIVLKIEIISLNYRYLLPNLVPWLTLSGSNYPCLERISMVPKTFEPFRFDCTLHQMILCRWSDPPWFYLCFSGCQWLRCLLWALILVSL